MQIVWIQQLSDFVLSRYVECKLNADIAFYLFIYLTILNLKTFSVPIAHILYKKLNFQGFLEELGKTLVTVLAHFCM